MKKKIVMAIAVLGMAFAGQVFAQDENARLSPPPKWASIVRSENGIYDCTYCNFFGNCGVVNCAG